MSEFTYNIGDTFYEISYEYIDYTEEENYEVPIIEKMEIVDILEKTHISRKTGEVERTEFYLKVKDEDGGIRTIHGKFFNPSSKYKNKLEEAQAAYELKIEEYLNKAKEYIELYTTQIQHLERLKACA